MRPLLALSSLLAFGSTILADKDLDNRATAQKRIVQSFQAWTKSVERVAERLEKSDQTEESEQAKRLRRALRFAKDAGLLSMLQKQTANLESDKTFRSLVGVGELRQNGDKLQWTFTRLAEVLLGEELGRLHELSQAADTRIDQLDRIKLLSGGERSLDEQRKAIRSLLAELIRDDRLPAAQSEGVKILLAEALEIHRRLIRQYLTCDVPGIAAGWEQIRQKVVQARDQLHKFSSQVYYEIHGRKLLVESDWRERLVRRQREVVDQWQALTRDCRRIPIEKRADEDRQSFCKECFQTRNLQLQILHDLHAVMVYLKVVNAGEKALLPLQELVKTTEEITTRMGQPNLGEETKRMVEDVRDSLGKTLADLKVPSPVEKPFRHPLLDRLRELEKSQGDETEALRNYLNGILDRFRHTPHPRLQSIR
jgi:hypothetical protein